MPAMTNIGGFFAKIGLEPDKNSFETGAKLVDNTANAFNKLIGAAKNAAVVLAMDKLGASESELSRTSKTIGVAAETLNVWSTAAKIAGVNADGVISSMGQLADVMAHLKIDGKGINELQDKLSKLFIGYDEIQNLTADQAYAYILQKAQTLAEDMNPVEIAARVQDVLGDSGQDLFLYMQKYGLSPEQLLNGASLKIFTNPGDNDAASKFYDQWNETKTTIENIAKALGIDGMKRVTPVLEKLNNWVDTGGGEKIRQTMDKIWGVVDLAVDQVIKPAIQTLDNWWKVNGDIVRDTLLSIYTTLVAVLGWLSSEKGKGLFSGIAKFNETTWQMTKDLGIALWQGRILTDGPVILENAFDDMKDNVVDTYKKVSGKTQDGILRPDGTLTQVAPDDWVFAVRNVGDLAKAFIPQGIAQPVAENNEYIINQEITINGGNDMPQVLRQQAYNGAQEGLLAAMAHSSQRLQLMSGTR